MYELYKANLIFLATSHFYLIQNNSGDFFIHYLSQMENFIFRKVEQIKNLINTKTVLVLILQAVFQLL